MGLKDKVSVQLDAIEDGKERFGGSREKFKMLHWRYYKLGKAMPS